MGEEIRKKELKDCFFPHHCFLQKRSKCQAAIWSDTMQTRFIYHKNAIRVLASPTGMGTKPTPKKIDLS